MSDQSKGIFLGLAAALIWSGFILVSRIGGISELSSYDVIAIRYLVCASIVIPLWLFRFRFKLLSFKLFITSLVGGLAYALFTFNGFQLAPASHAAILLPGLMPLFIIVLGVLVNAEKIQINRWIGLGLITTGIIGLFVQQIGMESIYIDGDLCLVAGAFCWGLFSVLIKRWEINPWQVTVSLAVYTSAIYLPIYVTFLSPNLSLHLWQDIALQAFYQGFMATIIQMIIYVRAIQLIGPSSMGMLMSIVPLISVLAAIFLLGEKGGYGVYIALLLVCMGAIFASGKGFDFSGFNRRERARINLVDYQSK